MYIFLLPVLKYERLYYEKKKSFCFLNIYVKKASENSVNDNNKINTLLHYR